MSDVPDRSMCFDPVKDPEARRYLAWHEEYFVEFADRMRAAIRKENPEAVIFVNHSANRTWYFPEAVHGRVPDPLRRRRRRLVGRAVLGRAGRPALPAVRLRLHAGRSPTSAGRRSGSSRRPTASRGWRRRWRSSSAGLEGTPWGVVPEFVESAGREEYLKLHLANMKAREAWLEKSEAVLVHRDRGLGADPHAVRAQAALPVYFSHTLGAFRALPREARARSAC